MPDSNPNATNIRYRLVTGVVLQNQPLQPFEAFVATRVEFEALSFHELLLVTGVDEGRLGSIVENLVALGVLEIAEASERASKTSVRVSSASGNAAVAADDCDLAPERRRIIDNVYRTLAQLNYYELLGVGTDAEARAIRQAYFERSKSFHPDTVFGQKLGPYKSKMEAVFRGLTDAFATLSNAGRRSAYDAELRAAGRFPATPEPQFQSQRSTSGKVPTMRPEQTKRDSAPRDTKADAERRRELYRRKLAAALGKRNNN